MIGIQRGLLSTSASEVTWRKLYFSLSVGIPLSLFTFVSLSFVRTVMILLTTLLIYIRYYLLQKILNCEGWHVFYLRIILKHSRQTTSLCTRKAVFYQILSDLCQKFQTVVYPISLVKSSKLWNWNSPKCIATPTENSSNVIWHLFCNHNQYWKEEGKQKKKNPYIFYLNNFLLI